jgi:hypothetical protein
VKPERDGEKFLEDDDAMVAPREVRDFVTEHCVHFAAAKPVRPAERYQHILSDYSSRYRREHIRALQQSWRISERIVDWNRAGT